MTIQRLMKMRQNLFPKILFLMETKNCRNLLVGLQVWLGYDGVFTINFVGLGRGLTLLWEKT